MTKSHEGARPRTAHQRPCPAATMLAGIASSVASGGWLLVMAPSKKVPVPPWLPSPPVLVVPPVEDSPDPLLRQPAKAESPTRDQGADDRHTRRTEPRGSCMLHSPFGPRHAMPARAYESITRCSGKRPGIPFPWRGPAPRPKTQVSKPHLRRKFEIRRKQGLRISWGFCGPSLRRHGRGW